jgi:hypothetical protein
MARTLKVKVITLEAKVRLSRLIKKAKKKINAFMVEIESHCIIIELLLVYAQADLGFMVPSAIFPYCAPPEWRTVE